MSDLWPVLRRTGGCQAKDPMAAVCVLATVDENGMPQARTLVLRHSRGLAIYINASSPKWQQSQECVAIQVWWPSVQINGRIQARCEALPAQHIAESWQLRPDVPKQMDWLYQQRPQSSEVTDRDELINLLKNTNHRHHWWHRGARGLLLLPERIDRLDLNQANGVHDRTRYVLDAGRWLEQTLIPKPFRALSWWLSPACSSRQRY